MGPPRERGGELWLGQEQAIPVPLQWGRRVNAAESIHFRFNPPALGDASMGPPRERGGEGEDDEPPKEDEALQWGRRVNAAESGQHQASGCGVRGFNGAAA